MNEYGVMREYPDRRVMMVFWGTSAQSVKEAELRNEEATDGSRFLAVYCDSNKPGHFHKIDGTNF